MSGVCLSVCLWPSAALKLSLVVVKLRPGGVHENLRSNRDFRESSFTDRHASRDFRESNLTGIHHVTFVKSPHRHTSRDFCESHLTGTHHVTFVKAV